MPRDHFVPQVYLKGFRDNASNNRLHCFRKTDLKKFSAHTRDVMFEMDGNRLKYSNNPSELEELAAWIEPSLDRCREAVGKKTVDSEVRMRLSFFVAYLTIASPTFQRLTEPLTKHLFKRRAQELDQMGLLSPAPEEAPENIRGKTLSKLFEEGMVVPEVDNDVARTFAMQKIGEIAKRYTTENGRFLRRELANGF